MSIDDGPLGSSLIWQAIMHRGVGSSPHSTSGDRQSLSTLASPSLAVMCSDVGDPAAEAPSWHTWAESPSAVSESTCAQRCTDVCPPGLPAADVVVVVRGGAVVDAVVVGASVPDVPTVVGIELVSTTVVVVVVVVPS